MSKLYKQQSSRENSSFSHGWDFLAIVIIFAFIIIICWTAWQMTAPYNVGDPLEISLNPYYLPIYGLRTVIRIFIGIILSLAFTFVVGTLAAKNKQAEKIIIPLIDVLQAVPVLSFLSITIVLFIALFPGRLLGPECASIFCIFTAQVWNITLGFYQTVKSVPRELQETASMFHLSSWQKFWRIEVPFSMSSLIWNSMMSLSASWFFVVSSEAIMVSNQEINLPGIGSYIAYAIDTSNIEAVLYAIFTMLVIIILYDQILFRPLLAWSERFNTTKDPDDGEATSWLLDWIEQSKIIRFTQSIFKKLIFSLSNSININKKWSMPTLIPKSSTIKNITKSFLLFILISGSILGGIVFINHVKSILTLQELLEINGLSCITAIRVLALIIISSIIWLPVGVYIGQRPKLANRLQPIIQFLAAFPANLLFPLIVIIILKYDLNKEIWVTPLMILGSQWYILFNVIAGTLAIPKDLYLVTKNLGLSGVQWWKRFMLPAIFPYYITGAITSAGGAWNASIVAEWVNWGNNKVIATGIGAYIKQNTIDGDFPRIALATATMCIYVLIFNKVLWQPLYNLAQNRFSHGSL